MYPEYAEIDGEQYKIDTDYKTALRCFEIIEDENICDEERALAIIYLLFDFIPDENLELFFEKATFFLQCGENFQQQSQKECDMDFQEDRKYIMSSFMSDYHMDLNKIEYLHFWQFIELIQGLKPDSSLNRVRDLRNYDVSQITDLKERKKIIDAKEQVSLKKRNINRKFTEKEKENINDFYKLTGITRKE